MIWFGSNVFFGNKYVISLKWRVRVFGQLKLFLHDYYANEIEILNEILPKKIQMAHIWLIFYVLFTFGEFFRSAECIWLSFAIFGFSNFLWFTLISLAWILLCCQTVIISVPCISFPFSTHSEWQLMICSCCETWICDHFWFVRKKNATWNCLSYYFVCRKINWAKDRNFPFRRLDSCTKTQIDFGKTFASLLFSIRVFAEHYAFQYIDYFLATAFLRALRSTISNYYQCASFRSRNYWMKI